MLINRAGCQPLLVAFYLYGCTDLFGSIFCHSLPARSQTDYAKRWRQKKYPKADSQEIQAPERLAVNVSGQDVRGPLVNSPA
jgi:hypothetical protein